MTGVNDSFRLAPAGVLRAAAWPVSCLAGFGDLQLGDRLRHEAAGHARNAEFEQDYERTLAREREYLWGVTAEDPRFSKALALASPSAHARVLAASARRGGPRNRAMRIAEHTLYRYLARAAGRATPHGLWAGVTELRWGERTRVERAAPRYAFVPDLRPFQTLIRGLAARPEYRSNARWRLNATVCPDADGGWLYFGRPAEGGLAHRAVDASGDLSMVLPILADLPPMPLDRLALEVLQRESWPGGSRSALPKLLDALAEEGILVGGMDLPTKFETPGMALRRAADDLRVGERKSWEQTVRELEDHCEALSFDAETIPPEEFVARLERSRDCITSLADAYGLSGSIGAGHVLRCDLHLPWRVTLDETYWRTILSALHDYEFAWLRGASPASAERELMRSKLARRMSDGVPIAEATHLVAQESSAFCLSWPNPDEVPESALASRIRHWEACLATPGEEVVLAPHAQSPQHAQHAASPLGCFVVGLSQGARISARSVSDLPTMASARFSDLLDDSSLNEWIRAEFALTVANTGISLAELHAPFEANPNALARPSLLGDALDPWGAGSDSLSLVGAKIRVHPPTGRLVLELAGAKRPWAVLTLGVANMRADDPLSQLLLCTGFHEFPSRRQRAVDIPTASEVANPRFAPRVMLPHGAVLRGRRSVLTEYLPHLLRTRGSERFRAWQQYAHELGWPEHLRVSAGTGEGMRIHRDSPIAVEAFFKGIGIETPFIVIEEASADHGLRVPGHGTHVAELALPFARQFSASAT
ncbi:MAG: lantibiotic dehydratase [Betaproteobacteria bacterium]